MKGDDVFMSKKTHMFKRPQDTVRVIPKILNEELPNRQGPQTPKYIVIHEVSLGTGRSPESFNMLHYEEKINADAEKGSTIGYHYLVGDKEVWQFLEDDVATSHTGTDFGNKNSIGIERVIALNCYRSGRFS